MCMYRSKQIRLFHKRNRGDPPTQAHRLVERAFSFKQRGHVIAIYSSHEYQALTGLLNEKRPATSGGVFHRRQVFL